MTEDTGRKGLDFAELKRLLALLSANTLVELEI